MKSKVFFTKNAGKNNYFVREGATIFGDGGRIVGSYYTLAQAKLRAKQRKEIVGNKAAVTIEKFVLGTMEVEA